MVALATTRRLPPNMGPALLPVETCAALSYLSLAYETLQGLIDPGTQRGSQPGARLLRPFHESLLWYDARKIGTKSSEYTVRKVYMRGSGITLARLLADPADDTVAELGRDAVAAIRDALTMDSPLATISDRLESALPPDASYTRPPDLEADEQAAWDRGADPKLAQLTRQLCRHAEGVMLQAGASGPARLWQLRSILALDLAVTSPDRVADHFDRHRTSSTFCSASVTVPAPRILFASARKSPTAARGSG